MCSWHVHMIAWMGVLSDRFCCKHTNKGAVVGAMQKKREEKVHEESDRRKVYFFLFASSSSFCKTRWNVRSVERK